MKILIPILGAAILSGCLFQSSDHGETNLMDQNGINKELPRDSIELKNWSISSYASKNKQLDFFRFDSTRALMLGIDSLGGQIVKNQAYFRMSTTDSANVLLNAGDTAFFAVRIDSLYAPSGPIKIKLSWSPKWLASYGTEISDADADSIDNAFFGPDSLWHKELRERDAKGWATQEVEVTATEDRWLRIPFPLSALNVLREHRSQRQALDFKVESVSSALPLVSNSTSIYDTASTPRLLVGKSARRCNRFAQSVQIEGADSKHLLSNVITDTLRVKLPVSQLRQALKDKGHLVEFSGDSATGPLVLDARLTLSGFSKLSTLYKEPVRFRAFYHVDSSLYNSALNYFEYQYDSNVIIKDGALDKVQFQVGSALSRALMQTNRTSEVELYFTLSSEQKADSTLRKRRSLALLEITDSLSAGLKLIYSPQKGIYTKELR